MHCNLLQNICLQHSEGPFFKKHSKIQSFCHPIILALFGKLLKTEYRFLLHAFKFIYFNYTINCNLPYYFLKHMITIQVNLANENTINFPIMNCLLLPCKFQHGSVKKQSFPVKYLKQKSIFELLFSPGL